MVYMSFGLESFFFLQQFKFLFSSINKLHRVTYFNFSALVFPLWEFCLLLSYSPWYRKMMKSLKVTYLFPQGTYWPSVFGKGDAQNVVLHAVCHSSQVYCLGSLPLLCQWATFGIPCPWTITALLASSPRLPGPAYAHVLGKPSHPLWRASVASVS